MRKFRAPAPNNCETALEMAFLSLDETRKKDAHQVHVRHVCSQDTSDVFIEGGPGEIVVHGDVDIVQTEPDHEQAIVLRPSARHATMFVVGQKAIFDLIGEVVGGICNSAIDDGCPTGQVVRLYQTGIMLEGQVHRPILFDFSHGRVSERVFWGGGFAQDIEVGAGVGVPTVKQSVYVVRANQMGGS